MQSVAMRCTEDGPGTEPARYGPLDRCRKARVWKLGVTREGVYD